MPRDNTKYVIKCGEETASDLGKRKAVETVLDFIFDSKIHGINDQIKAEFLKKAQKRWIKKPSEYHQPDTDTKRYYEKKYSWGNGDDEHSFYFWNNWGVGNIYIFLGIVDDIFQNQSTKITWERMGKENEPAVQNSITHGISPVCKHQVIYFGAPGTGKSHKLKEDSEKAEFLDIERVTFYPGYSYQQFVGTYKPHMNGEKIEYKFVPGPLIRTLVKALKAKEPEKEKYLLIIEELNRAEAAAVFGDLFQLLDRKKNMESEYPVAVSEDLKEYLAKEGLSCTTLLFPSNFYIWTTMNSADQGVFPLDTAFKRRWEFKYIGIDDNEEEIKNDQWKEFRGKINKKMLLSGVNEDKLLGPFFLKESEQEDFIESFCGKVLLYLFEDAMRLKRKDIFEDKYCKSYSDLCDAFRDGKSVFRDLPDLNLSDSEETDSEDTSSSQTDTAEEAVSEEKTPSDSL